LLDISLLATGKGDLCRDIMGELPGWFDQPEANADCANIVEQLPLLACHVDGVVVGFAALQPHPPSAMEIFVGGAPPVPPPGHRASPDRRIGTVRPGRRVPSADGEDARAERSGRAAICSHLRLHEGSGFIRAEVFPKFWHEDFPCLFLVKPLDRRLS
jgi:hypothetical protein